MNILVVDDSKAMRMIVVRNLRSAGYESDNVVEADSGRAALDHIAANDVDVVLSDWNMPEMGGLELLTSLRATGWSGPFGFITSESADSYYNQAMEAGANFLVVKPFTADSLRSAVQQAFEKTGART